MTQSCGFAISPSAWWKKLTSRRASTGCRRMCGWTNPLRPLWMRGPASGVVRPELTARGVSGLDTVLSGVFIEGSWDNTVGRELYRFKGLEEPPLFRSGQNGLQIAVRTTPGGSLTDNSPILYRGIEVGRVGTARITPSGNYAIAEAIIFDPHSGLVNASTRFWDSSGFSVSIGPQGAEIDFSSLATLVGGGLTFDTFVSGGAPVTDGTVFEVFADQATARNSVFNASEVETLDVRVVFDDNIAGLAIGAAVELSGPPNRICFRGFGRNRCRCLWRQPGPAQCDLANPTGPIGPAR